VNAISRQPPYPAKGYNSLENTGIFQRVPTLGGLGGIAKPSLDPWRAKIPPKVAPTPAQTAKPPTPAQAHPAFPAPSAPALVPLREAWIDGQRYREAGATEWPSRLDLFVADEAGPWIRRHGVLIKVP
jgi:hypothetical protein